MNEHILERFDAELDKLRSRLIKMGTLVQQQIDYSIKAIADDDKSLAELVILGDDKIDKIDIKIDKQCMRIFAMLQPVASDLRITMSALSINDNMELIGDILVEIAETIKKLPEASPLVSKVKLIEFSRTIEKMINMSLDSFIYANSNLAYEAVDLQKVAREQFHATFDYHVGLIKSDVSLTEYCSYLNDICRNMIFISDLALNIAQEIIFIVEAKIVRHSFQLNKDELYEGKKNNTDEDEQNEVKS